jgi:NAD dependent epimerase/dehydratase family enzyme
MAVPRWAARLAFGEMADQMLLSSARVIPSRLAELGFAFEHGRLKDALEWELDKRKTGASPRCD